MTKQISCCMATRQKFKSFSEMPEGLRKFLYSKDFADAEKLLQAQYKFKDEQTILIGDKMMNAIFGDIQLSQAVSGIKAGLVPAVLDQAGFAQMLSDLLKIETWPIRDLFGEELTAVLNEYGISSATWPLFKVHLLPVTYSAAATEVAALSGFSLLGTQMRERLRDLIMSRAKNVRVDAQVREALVRPADFGGLGLDEATADKTIQNANQLIASAQLMSEDEYSNWLSDEARKKSEAQAQAEVASASTEEEEEIAKIKAGMPPKPASVLDEAVEKAYAGLTFRPPDEYLSSRLRHIISSRLRDIRNSLEVEQLLQRDTKVGGVGLDQAQARQLAQQIEAAYAASHDAVLSDEKQKIESEMQSQKSKIEERKKREADEHAKWYQEKIQARKQEEEKQKQLADQLKQSFKAAGGTEIEPVHPLDIKEKKLEIERFGEMVTAIQAGASPLAEPAAKQPSAATVLPAKQAMPPAWPVTPQQAASASVPVINAPVAPKPSIPIQAARPEVKVSKETIIKQPLSAGLKPRVEDVKFGSPKLMSLIDELKQMTVSEFRRMAKNPDIAAQKILQKVETLSQESFEQRVRGIQAFQASALQQAYLALVSETFRLGKSVQEVADAKRVSGLDTLSPAEVSAVISLNSKLHF